MKIFKLYADVARKLNHKRSLWWYLVSLLVLRLGSIMAARYYPGGAIGLTRLPPPWLRKSIIQRAVSGFPVPWLLRWRYCGDTYQPWRRALTQPSCSSICYRCLARRFDLGCLVGSGKATHPRFIRLGLQCPRNPRGPHIPGIVYRYSCLAGSGNTSSKNLSFPCAAGHESLAGY